MAAPHGARTRSFAKQKWFGGARTRAGARTEHAATEEAFADPAAGARHKHSKLKQSVFALLYFKIRKLKNSLQKSSNLKHVMLVLKVTKHGKQAGRVDSVL